MSIFKITIKAGTPATFSPSPQKVCVNDSVFWFNGDKVAHWPAPSAADPKGFMQFQVAPNSPSDQVVFGTVKTITYICVNHPGESGKIIVDSCTKKTKKGAFGKKTKKGAFGLTTKRGAR